MQINKSNYEQFLDFSFSKEFNFHTNSEWYKNFLIEEMMFGNSEFLILQLQMADNKVGSFKFQILQEYLKELLKYDYDICRKIQDYVETNHFKFSKNNLSEFQRKIKTVNENELERLFSLHPETYPENLFLIAQKTNEGIMPLNKLMHTHLIEIDKESGVLFLKKFNKIDSVIEIKSWAQ